MATGRPQKLSEITNTPKTKKRIVPAIEKACVVADEDILDLNILENSDDLFSDLKLDFSDLIFKNRN